MASNGNDAAACSRTAPSRNFAAALAAVNSGGEVIVLDSAGYGPATINKAVSIIAPSGVYGGITSPSGTDAVAITAGSFDTVTLSGLTLNGLGGQYGVHIFTADTVHVENCTITGFVQSNGKGIRAAESTLSQLHISDSTIRNNETGIYLLGPSAVLMTSIHRVILSGQSLSGLYAADNTQTTVTDSIATSNGNAGFQAVGNGAAALRN